MATNIVRIAPANWLPTHINRKDKPSKHASMWNAMAARRAELHKDVVSVKVKSK